MNRPTFIACVIAGALSILLGWAGGSIMKPHMIAATQKETSK